MPLTPPPARTRSARGLDPLVVMRCLWGTAEGCSRTGAWAPPRNTSGCSGGLEMRLLALRARARAAAHEHDELGARQLRNAEEAPAAVDAGELLVDPRADAHEQPFARLQGHDLGIELQ